MTKPLNYDATMLLRLTTEMKDAFFAGCKARGVVPSEEARQLITDYVLNHWGIDKPKTPDIIALERCDTTLDMFPADQLPRNKTTSAPTSATTSAKKRKKGVKVIQ